MSFCRRHLSIPIATPTKGRGRRSSQQSRNLSLHFEELPSHSVSSPLAPPSRLCVAPTDPNCSHSAPVPPQKGISTPDWVPGASAAVGETVTWLAPPSPSLLKNLLMGERGVAAAWHNSWRRLHCLRRISIPIEIPSGNTGRGEGRAAV